MERVSDFAARLRQYRRERSMTLRELSARTGVPAQTLSRYELGHRSPKAEVAIRIAQGIGVDPLWLQGFDLPERENPAPRTGDGYDPLTERFIALVGQLTQEQKKALLAYLIELRGTE